MSACKFKPGNMEILKSLVLQLASIIEMKEIYRLPSMLSDVGYVEFLFEKIHRTNDEKKAVSL